MACFVMFSHMVPCISQDKMADEHPSKRRRTMVQEVAVEYRCTRSQSRVDIGATVHRALQDMPEEDAAQLIPLFIERLVEPRISVFTLLTEHLGQTFSLDNGLAVQEMILLWLRLWTTGRKGSNTESTMSQLKKNKVFHSVWWEARVVKIWAWPGHLQPAVVKLGRTLVERGTASPTVCATHGYDGGSFQSRNLFGRNNSLSGVRPVFHTTEDICAACTATMLEQLRLDYKCISLQSPSHPCNNA